jgi:hypothetical protein
VSTSRSLEPDRGDLRSAATHARPKISKFGEVVTVGQKLVGPSEHRRPPLTTPPWAPMTWQVITESHNLSVPPQPWDEAAAQHALERVLREPPSKRVVAAGGVWRTAALRTLPLLPAPSLAARPPHASHSAPATRLARFTRSPPSASPASLAARHPPRALRPSPTLAHA